MKLDQYVQNRPIVFFPECTKTNGKGVLNIPEQALKMIDDAVKHEFKIHTLRFDFKFKNTSPYNTTNVRGVRHSIRLLTQFLNQMTVQHFFNLQLGLVSETSKTPDYEKLVKSTLMSPGREYELQLDYIDH